MNNKHGWRGTFGMGGLLIVALACTCGPVSQAIDTASTAQAVATEVGEVAPTLQAGATEFADIQPTLDAAMTAAAGAGGITEGTQSSPYGSVYDGGDGLPTTLVEQIAVGGAATGTIGGLFEAHNYLFEGTAGQSVTIRVEGSGSADPRVFLIDPSGTKIAEDDDSGGGANGTDSLLTFTLPSDGTYTIRVDMISMEGGTYTVTLE